LASPDLHPEIRQDLVLLKSGEANPAAQALLRFLREPATRRLIASVGYAVPAP
jgi:molybdate transport system substrate-binding protein